MNSFIRFMFAVGFVLVLALTAAAEINPAELSPVSRTDIGEDIAYYIFEVNVDTDPYGKIRLHRFIREPQPYQPIPNLKGLLHLPGLFATVNMYATSLSSEHATWDHSILVFLAKNNIDVWGIDYAWALVPVETEDFRFMKNWTMERDVRHAAAALSIVRTIREYTGQGTSKLTLLGHSYGADVGFDVLSRESQKPSQARNAMAFVPVETFLKFPPDSPAIAEICAEVDQLRATWDSGSYVDNGGLFLSSVAALAKYDPEGPSPIVPGVTNYQAFLYVVAGLFGVYFNEYGIPTGLRFTDTEFAIDVIQGFAPYVPVKVRWQQLAFTCGEVYVPVFEHLDQIGVPILYVGAAGSIGEDGYYTLTLTGSDDISQFTVQLLTDEERQFDFGHVEPFAANDAENLVWKPILDWINAH